MYMGCTPLVGGYGGGPDGAAIVAVASFIAVTAMGADVCHIGPQHIKYKQQTNLHSLFLGSLANQAVNRNTRIITTTSHTTAGRPGSDQYAYEFSALALSVVPSGSNVSGPRPAEPLGYNNVSPLMARLFAEVAHAASRLSRAEAAPIVAALYEKYRDKISLDLAPKGRPFEELYDVATLTPTPEHRAQYERIKEELVGMGVPIR
jgi:methylamine--corrinoid protein Co-methyltransferase